MSSANPNPLTIPPELEAETEVHWVEHLDGFFEFLDTLVSGRPVGRSR